MIHLEQLQKGNPVRGIVPQQIVTLIDVQWHGSNAAFARLIDEKATIIIIGNRFTRTIYNAAHLCYDLFGDYQQRKMFTDDEIDSIESSKKATALPKGPKKLKR